MRHPLPIHKYFMTTGCCVSSLWIRLGLSHPLPNSCCPAREQLQFLHFFNSLHASACKFVIVPKKCDFHGGFALGGCTFVSWACLVLQAELPFSRGVALPRPLGYTDFEAQFCKVLPQPWVTSKWRCHRPAGLERSYGPQHTKAMSSGYDSISGG